MRGPFKNLPADPELAGGFRTEAAVRHKVTTKFWGHSRVDLFAFWGRKGEHSTKRVEYQPVTKFVV